jgi:hypothetical protein
MAHAVTEEQIEDLALGILSTEEAIQIQRHTFGCEDCLLRLIEITLVQEEQAQRRQRNCRSMRSQRRSGIIDTRSRRIPT